MNEVTPEQVGELAGKATDGPWFRGIYEIANELGDGVCYIARMPCQDILAPFVDSMEIKEDAFGNHDFIIAARNNWPRHASELLSLRKEAARLREDAARYRYLRSEGLDLVDWGMLTTETCDVGLDHAIDSRIKALSPNPKEGQSE